MEQIDCIEGNRTPGYTRPAQPIVWSLSQENLLSFPIRRGLNGSFAVVAERV